MAGGTRPTSSRGTPPLVRERRKRSTCRSRRGCPTRSRLIPSFSVMAWPTPPSSRPGRSGTWWWLAPAPASGSRSRPRRSTGERPAPSLPTPRPSRSDSPALRGGWLGHRRGRQPEVFVESVEDGADAVLVRLVGGRAVEGEGDGQPLL